MFKFKLFNLISVKQGINIHPHITGTGSAFVWLPFRQIDREDESMNKLVMVVVLGMLATAAMAAGDQASFSEADSNKDGAITRAEAASFAALEQGFDAADLNKNGLIEPNEYSQMGQTTAETNK
jgi:hypothetical protein